MKLFSNLKTKIFLKMLNRIIAGLLDKFKLANPTVYTIVMAVLGVLFYALDSCNADQLLAFCSNEAVLNWAGEIKMLIFGTAALAGSRTTRFKDA